MGLFFLWYIEKIFVKLSGFSTQRRENAEVAQGFSLCKSSWLSGYSGFSAQRKENAEVSQGLFFVKLRVLVA